MLRGPRRGPFVIWGTKTVAPGPCLIREFMHARRVRQAHLLSAAGSKGVQLTHASSAALPPTASAGDIQMQGRLECSPRRP